MLRRTAYCATAAMLLLGGWSVPAKAGDMPGVTATEIKVGAVFGGLLNDDAK